MSFKQLYKQGRVQSHKPTKQELDYDRAGLTSESEAEELVEKAEEFRDLVEAWIKKHHRKLSP